MRKHINEFIRLKCASDLLALNLFPNAKEITESMAGFDAVRRIVIPNTNLKLGVGGGVTVFVVGDGSVPRTGGMFAFRSAWDVVSIDPALRRIDYKISRLTCYDKKIEDIGFVGDGTAIIVLVHSHATISSCLENIQYPLRHLVTIPCCVPHSLPNKKYIGYTDSNIWSEKNEVRVWLNV